MPFHQFKFCNTLTIPQSTKKKKKKNSFISIKSFNNDSNIYPWKIIPTKKFPYPWKIIPKHPNKISVPIKNELTQFCLHFKLTINQKLSNNVQKSYPTQNITNDQHCPNFTIPNNSTIQKCPKIKNQHNHTMISIQIILYPKIPTRSNNNKMTMPHHKFFNKTWNQ